MVAVVVLLAGGVAAAVVFAPSKTKPRAGTSTDHSSSPTNPPVHSSSGSGGVKSGSSKRHSITTSAPPTLEPTTFNTTAATYAAPGSTYTLDVAASGPCWILATESTTGQVLWTGTMQAGESRSIPGSGSVFVRLGAAFSVVLTLNGVPVSLPVGHGSPFNVTFQPA